jgi:rhodanese-related sulfurtransferase
MLGLPHKAVIIDVRSNADCAAQPRFVPGARRREAHAVHAWAQSLPRASVLVVCDALGNELAAEVAASLSASGYAAYALEGGVHAWMTAGCATVTSRPELNAPGGSHWVTRERPKIDRLACPWLIRRFIDPDAQFFYTPSHRVRTDAAALGAEPYDIPDVTFSHRGARCSFDAFLEEFELRDPVLNRMADIVRAADTGALAESREAHGLLAISLGLAANIHDDILLLEQAMSIYDALYAWCKTASHGAHVWPQAPSASQATHG